MKDAALRFLADESCDFGVVKALRAEGYDVLALTEITTRSADCVRKYLREAVVKLIREQGNEIQNGFVVIQPGHIRVNRKK
jgi:hypothetical protein